MSTTSNSSTSGAISTLLDSSQDGSLKYLDSTNTIHSYGSTSIQSIFPPRSWPSGDDLHQDSNDYPSSLSGSQSYSSVDSNIYRTDLHKNIAFQSELEREEVEELEESTPRTRIIEFEPEIEAKIKNSEEQSNIPSLNEVLILPLQKDILKNVPFMETLIVSKELKNSQASNEIASNVPNLVEENNILEVGGFCLNIEQSGSNFVIYSTSQFSSENSGVITSILSIVDESLNLIEEKKIETICQTDIKIEKKLHVLKDESGYVVLKSSNNGAEKESERGTISLKSSENLILDGASFLLMRYLILSGFRGEFKTWSINISGGICCCKYQVQKERVFLIQNKPVKCIRIKLWTCHSKTDVAISKTYLTDEGHILKHKWEGRSYFLHINPLAEIPLSNYVLESEKSWQNDVKLMSLYLDYKYKRQQELSKYLSENVEIQCMIKDYLVCLLQLKPKEILDFTVDYFLDLVSDD